MHKGGGRMSRGGWFNVPGENERNASRECNERQRLSHQYNFTHVRGAAVTTTIPFINVKADLRTPSRTCAY